MDWNRPDRRAMSQSNYSIITTLLVSLVQTRRIPYPLIRDRGPGARSIGAARDVSRSVHPLFRSPRARHVRQPVPARLAERQRAEVDAADAWTAERRRLLSRPAALHHACDVGGSPILAAPP